MLPRTSRTASGTGPWSSARSGAGSTPSGGLPLLLVWSVMSLRYVDFAEKKILSVYSLRRLFSRVPRRPAGDDEDCRPTSQCQHHCPGPPCQLGAQDVTDEQEGRVPGQEGEGPAHGGRAQKILHNQSIIPLNHCFLFYFAPLVVVIKIKLLCNKIKVEMKKMFIAFCLFFYLFLLANTSAKESSESLRGFFCG